MRVLYLYTEVMGYNLPIFEELALAYGATVDVVHWNKDKLTPFVPQTTSPNIGFHERSSFTAGALMQFVTDLRPDLVYVSGWQDRGYLPVLGILKSRGAVIVMGLDSQWTGSVRQQVGAKMIKWFYKPRYFHYAWVPGPMQYAYASRIGFAKNEIICNLLSANTSLFARALSAPAREDVDRYPQRFLYVGRFTESKGVDTLMRAYEMYRQQLGGSWTLTCIGNGPLESLIRSNSQIEVLPFMSQADLACHAHNAGAFILPSQYEPWGVVVHEFASAGLPLILSDQVGASPQFLVSRLNGFVFEHDSADDLAKKMWHISSLTPRDLIRMGDVSRQLASVLNPSVVAASLVSVLGKPQDP
jgi:glycosyltransferase involved in cell wall biosynthesis